MRSENSAFERQQGLSWTKPNSRKNRAVAMAGMHKEQGSSHGWDAERAGQHLWLGCLCTKSQCLRLLRLGEARAGAEGDRLIKFIKVPQSPKASFCFNTPTLPKWWKRSKDTNPHS